jgi:putative ATP-dependent endonuclease of the OLD family
MYLKSLEINNFRKFRNLKIKFTKGLNLLIGENDAGKTAIIGCNKICCQTKC